MYIPSSTYRIQLNKDFTFKDLLQIIDYLHALGVSTIYAAPILKSTKGSTHGYDVTDPHTIDPEIGTIDELKAIADKLRSKGMTWLQDIVPNHMAFDPTNFRLMDVLERGSASPFYNYFDIDWNHPSPFLKNKLMVPFLGNELVTCVNNGEIKLTFTQKGFEISYFETQYPVSAVAYNFLFNSFDTPSTRKLLNEWNHLMEDHAFKSDYFQWLQAKMDWLESIPLSEQETIREIIDATNLDTETFLSLLSHQHYVLTHWKQTENEINYRRFFTVNQLICLRMEDESVFNEYHSFLSTLYKQKLIQGFRIDHIDGLQDPRQYIKNLRKLFGEDCYIIAEKILEAKESMPSDWPLQGTSGYEFLAHVNQLFTDKAGAKQLLDYYRTLVPELPSYRQLVAKNKKMILETYMAGEWDNLLYYLTALNLDGNLERSRLKQALAQLMVALPVYRIYPEEIPLTGDALAVMTEAFEKAGAADQSCITELKHLKALFFDSQARYSRENVLKFLKRLMQFTGPLTAKGVEDTTFYIYNPLISHDEVGDSPSTLGITINAFHRRMQVRMENTPLSLNATATHDTKRGEDVRARLNVLSQLPDEWQQKVNGWMENNQKFTIEGGNGRIPGVNDEYFMYQSVVGGFPEDMTASNEWIERLQAYFTKVVREAKVKSNWESPNENYERTCHDFIGNILRDEKKFLPDVKRFVERITMIANKHALGQILIKITSPGIPDIYQGCELWDLSYVDPDNRRPVDYALRKNYFGQIIQKEKEGAETLFAFLESHSDVGMEKLFVTWKALNFRKNNQQLFIEGTYIPLQVNGNKQLACVYARNYMDRWAVVAVSFGTPNATNENATINLEEGEAIVLLDQLPYEWTNLFSGKRISGMGYLPIKELFKDLPVALLYA